MIQNRRWFQVLFGGLPFGGTGQKLRDFSATVNNQFIFLSCSSRALQITSNNSPKATSKRQEEGRESPEIFW